MISPELLIETQEESKRQDAKWGEQNHPDGTGLETDPEIRDIVQKECDKASDGGYLTWRLIFLEEVWEALAESDPEKLKNELLQAAAVALQWYQAIDRRLAREMSERDVLEA